MTKPVRSTLDFGGLSTTTNLSSPVNDSDAATKGYVDSAVEGLAWKDAVRVASSVNINLASPGVSIDGITMVVNDRFLAKDQTADTENGIYIFNGDSTPATRALDTDDFDKLEQAVVSVEEGTSADTTFRQTEVNGTIDVSTVTFTSFGTAAPSATESVAGIAEIATQAETDAGSDNQRFVTPQALANYSGLLAKFAQTIGDGAQTSYTVTHNLGSRDVTVQVYLNSGNYDEVIVDVQRTDANSVTIIFETAPASNAYRVVVTG